jgi:hypothetical protein
MQQVRIVKRPTIRKPPPGADLDQRSPSGKPVKN